MNWLLLQNSLLVALGTVALSVSIGFVAAILLAGLSAQFRTLFLGGAVMALALPPFLVTNCWLHFFGQTGVWHSWLPLNIFSLGGTVWILSLLLWPLSLFLIWGSWQRLEASQLESDMMVTGWALLRALLFPLARGALVQAALLTFVLAINNFSVPAILQVKVFPAEIWILFNTTFKTMEALRLSWPLVLAPLIFIVWLARREFSWPHLASPVSGRLLRQQLGPTWFWGSGICTVFICLFSVVLPLFQILASRRTWTELSGALAASRSAVWNSFSYAAVAATAITVVNLAIVVFREIRNPKAEIRKKAEGRNLNRTKRSITTLLFPARKPHDGARNFGFGSRVSGFFRPSAFGLRLSLLLGWLAFLLPGVLLGIGLIHAFNHRWSAFLYQGAGIVILAFVIRYWVIGWHATALALRRVDPDLSDVARLEGATRWEMLRHAWWPQISRPVLAAWYILFLLCLWDAESMILVVPPGGETLALRIFNLLHYGHNAQVNALCLTLLGVALAPLLIWRLVTASPNAWRALISPGRRLARRSLLLFAGLCLLLQVSCTPPDNKVDLHSRIFDTVQIIGSRGVGVGQLNKPRSVAVDAADNLYVVDMTGRVQKFSTNGIFLLSWQMPQTTLGKPKGMCRDRAGNILVVEPHYSRVNVFSPQGKLLCQWGSHGTNAGQLSLPRAAGVNSRGDVFVSEYQEAERVQVFSFGPRGSKPEGGASSLAPPRWSIGFGKAGTGPGEFNRPEGLCVDEQDRVYVADSCNHRIQVFASDGNLLRSYGKAGTGPGELSYPYDICVDSAGRQYVCEFGNSRIQVFDAHDQPLEIIGGPGAEPGRFSNPWGVALDSAGNLYVADSQNHRVQKLVRAK